MRQWLVVVVMVASLATGAFGDDKKGPEIKIVDGKVDIHTDAIALGRLLRLFDMATGLNSTVPPELASRNVSVRFSGLTFDQAVEKIFEGASLDYLVVKGQGIMVMSASQRKTTTAAAPANARVPFNPQPGMNAPADEQPFFPPGPAGIGGQPQPFPGVVGGNMNQMPPGAQPAMIQTPFGPMPNPRAQQQPTAPLAVPGSNQPFGLANPGNPSSPMGDGSIPAFNPNPTTPATPNQNPFGVNPTGMPGVVPFPMQTPVPVRKPPGQ